MRDSALQVVVFSFRLEKNSFRLRNSVCHRRRHLAEQRERLGRVLEAIPDYLELASRTEVNRSLRELFEAVYVDSNGKIVRLELN